MRSIAPSRDNVPQRWPASGLCIHGLRLVLLGLLAAGAQASPVSRGAELLAPFKQELQEALTSALTRGPTEAIRACRQRAPEIARRLSMNEVRMGRTSHRLRNPANGPPVWVSPILTAYLADPGDRTPRQVALPDDRQGYVEPITLQPICTACHGRSLDPDVAGGIEALYPEDRAVGFEVGDLRGVFWVEFGGDR